MPRAIEQFLEISPLPGRVAPKDTLAGEAIIAKLTPAPGNNAPIGGLRAVVFNGPVRGPALRHREPLQDLCGELRAQSSPGCRR
jgi:phosphoglucomutase